jgi:NADH dehydrogenase
VRNLTGRPQAYRFRMLGQVATLGRFKGIAELPAHIRLRGYFAWWVTRSYHLYQVPGLSRKLRIVADWTIALFFRRDIAEISMLAERHKLGE